MKNYKPQAINTDDIHLSDELMELTEAMAENVHEVWALGRINDGWKYGEQRNDTLKLHPCLVAYKDLPESEKEFDRATAISTLKLIQKLGFEIKKRL
ncbi:Ryanodine receptor Ryr [Bacteroidales bacterium OttesenSCG-928-A17]|nr:Ryanodine receptor Ryr [Bacteroidales bacterium OttesenSCG-928-A17]